MAENYTMPKESELELARVRDQLEKSEQDRARLHDQVVRLEIELKRFAEEGGHFNDRLLHQQRMEATGTLAAGLAHDMNNVLASIMGFASLLLDDRHPPQVQADLEQILAEAERGAGLTRSLLAFSHKGQYRRQVLEIDNVIRGLLPLLTHTLSKTIEVRAELGAGSGRVDGDPVQLVQVLVNFALNAADAMSGRGELEISSDLIDLDAAAASALAVPQGRYARIRVTDTGTGMDEATRLRVFEPFFTTKPMGKGTGLGLSLVWGVIKGHDGAVGVESTPGKGTTFSVYLPLTDAQVAARVPDPKPRERSGPTTILIVDDEPGVLVGMRRILERTGYTVLAAGDGAEALRVFAEHRGCIGLVILDMGMPVMNGAECFHQLRTTSTVPVLIATGYAIDEDLQTLVARGVAVLEKPFASTSLVIEVTRLLEQTKQQARLHRG